MNTKKKFLIDECLPHTRIYRLQEVAGPAVLLEHTKLKFHQGILDEDWIPKIADEGGWVVISPDRGAHSRVDERLPAMCLEFGITHLLLSANVHRKLADEKIDAVCSLWSDIVCLSDAPCGSRHHMRIKSIHDGSTYSYVIVPDKKYGL